MRYMDKIWVQIKELFSGGSAPPIAIEPVKYEDGLLWFRSEEDIKLKPTKAYAASKLGNIELRIDVLSYNENDKLYRGKLQDETFNLDAMELTRRKEFRFDHAIRVSSDELPGAKVYTEDISLSGARIVIGDAVKPGDIVSITLHLSDPTTPSLNLRAQIKWCAPRRKNTYHCGVNFFTIEKAQKKVLSRYIKNKVAVGGK